MAQLDGAKQGASQGVKNMTVLEYVMEEVKRQGHDLDSFVDGGRRVGWMLAGWEYAMARAGGKPTVDDIIEIGKRVEREVNADGYRTYAIHVGTKPIGTHWVEIPSRLTTLLEQYDALEPLDFYRAFEQVHPFGDGNGRTGKILLNWRANRLGDPFFPPRDFWGTPIQNP